MDIVDITEAEIRYAVPAENNQIVFGGRAPLRIGRRLWALMWEEFQRNGRKTLTTGKVRYLRRVARGDRSVGRADAGLDGERFAAPRTIDMGMLTQEESDLIDDLGAR